MRERVEDTKGTIVQGQKETCYNISFYAVGSILCVVILINMYYNPNLFYVSYFNFLYHYFLKFIIHKMNS
jgi:hypothetical protein